jgi:hypothetical protein
MPSKTNTYAPGLAIAYSLVRGNNYEEKYRDRIGYGVGCVLGAKNYQNST